MAQSTSKTFVFVQYFFPFLLIFGITFFLVRCGNETNVTEPQSVKTYSIIKNEGKETCLNCHAEMTGFSPDHDPQKIGCASCHLGNPNAEEEDASHKGMVLIPGNVATADLTCGTVDCHPGIPQRVEMSLMNTMSGVITIDRYVFGESETFDAHEHVKDLAHSAADMHLRNLCVSCHLGREKLTSEPISESSRGGGCNACHLNYSEEALASLADYKHGESMKVHATLNMEITNDHCFGCHSRSGRISTSYEGWHETRYTDEEVAGKSGFRKLADGRNFEFIKEDVHHTYGLECIDCHNASEVMGDANLYMHSEEAVRVRCQDCHFTSTPEIIPLENLDAESKKIIALRSTLSELEQFVKGELASEAMINVSVDEAGHGLFVSKNSGKRLQLSPPAEICTRGDAHDDLTCSACHTSWTPQCIGCHNTYEPQTQSFDLLERKVIDGKWIEHLGEFFAEEPTLGIVESDEGRRVKTFVPGMVMTIDEANFPQDEAENDFSFHRLFAPLEAHTTVKEGRNCKSCHNDPLALGYGRGTLNYVIENGKGRWYFESAYANEEYDNLPQDAWIGFLELPQGTPATRHNARPFTPEEQKRILTVGACLTCHKDNSGVMMQSLDDFDAVLKRVSNECVLPEY
ncbi:MAG: hypothetical protein DWQ02_26050 [Bacteroidetes bacterium]|nr:MAG: hypothetical protein DWQ02_26050 [Bacteroidota bacterium]